MKELKGAGGTSGGVGRFFIGLVMMVAGGYLFLNSIQVSYGFHMGYSIYSFRGFNVTSGMVLIPFVFGIGFIFYNSKNPIGWVLSAASFIMFFFGIISSIRFTMRHMTAYELVMIIILLIGGIGLFLSSLKEYEKNH